MGTIQKLNITFPAPYAFAGKFSSEHVHCLSDGSILLYGRSNYLPGPNTPLGGYRLRPDATGNYANPTLTPCTPYQAGVHLYAGMALLVTGNLLLLSSEYGSGAGVTELYDVDADVWTIVHDESLHIDNSGIQASAHGVSYLLPDGRVIQDTEEAVNTFAADGTWLARVASSATPPIGDIRTIAQSNENGRCLLPDDTVLSHDLFGRGSIGLMADPACQLFHPSYNAGSGGWSAVQPGPGGRWGAGQYKTGYEVGPMLVSPKTGKAHLFGGDGRIYTFAPISSFDPNTTYPTAWSREIYTPAFWNPGAAAQSHLAAEHNGQTVSQLLTLDRMRVMGNASWATAAGWSATYSFVRLTDGTEVRVHWTAVAEHYDVDPPYAEMTGLSLGAGSASAVLHSGDAVTFGTTLISPQDASGVVLPGGSILYMSGHWSPAFHQPAFGAGFNDYGVLMLWDTQSAPVRLPIPDAPVVNGVGDILGPEFQVKMVLLPTGQVMIFDLLNIYLYTPDNSDGVADPAWAPTISTLPATGTVGGTMPLTGVQLSGLTEGGNEGDDWQSKTNFPIGRLTSPDGTRVIYLKTTGHTYRGIRPGAASSCVVHIPSTAPHGLYDFQVIANGIPSAPRALTLLPASAVGMAGRAGVAARCGAALGSAWKAKTTAAASLAATITEIFLYGTYGDGSYGPAPYGVFGGTISAGHASAAASAVLRGILSNLRPPYFGTGLYGDSKGYGDPSALMSVVGETSASAFLRASLFVRALPLLGDSRIAALLRGALGFATEIPVRTAGFGPQYDFAPRVSVGSTYELVGRFYLSEGVLVDPLVVTGKVVRPDNVVVDLDVARAAKGVYSVSVDFDVVGEWTVRLEGSAPAQVAIEQMIVVRHSRAG